MNTQVPPPGFLLYLFECRGGWGANGDCPLPDSFVHNRTLGYLSIEWKKLVSPFEHKDLRV